jgi:DNA-binding response OmpR family regulator
MQSTRGQNGPQILCLGQSPANLSPVLREIKKSGFKVTLALATEQAVAVCMNNQVEAVLLDAAFIRNDDWSVAKSLKLIKPLVPILLLDSRDLSRRNGLPASIDAVASANDPREVLIELKRCLGSGL